VQIIVMVRVDIEGVDGFGSGIFFWTLYGWREVPFARSISSTLAFVGWRVKETNCICVMVNEMTTWGVFFFLAITGR